MSFKPIDAKRDEYRKYLEQEGVVEVLSKAIVKLFDCSEKPENAIDFIRRNLGDAMLERDTIEQLKQELEDSRNEVAQLKRQLETLQLERAKGTASADAFDDEPKAVEQEKNVEESVSKDSEPLVEENPVSQNESEGVAAEDTDENEGKDTSNETESSENDQAIGASMTEEKTESNDPVPDEKQTSAEQKEGENAQ